MPLAFSLQDLTCSLCASGYRFAICSFVVKHREKLSRCFHVVPVPVAKRCDQIFLFVINTNQDVNRHCCCKQQVPHSHDWREPYADKYASHDRVTYVLVERV